MRSNKTFILRLYIDSELPDQLCGNVQMSSGRETFSFKNDAALIKLLRQLSILNGQNCSSKGLEENHEISKIEP